MGIEIFDDGYYRLKSERSSRKSIIQRVNGEWYCINEVGPISMEEINRRGWEIDSMVEDMDL